MRFCPLKPNKTLEIYGLNNKSLKEYSRDNKKYGYDNLPPIKYRLRDLEYKGINDENESKNKKEKADFNKIEEDGQKIHYNENRFSQKGKGGDASKTQSKDGVKAMGKDFRGSIAMKKRATADKVKLEDFDIES